MESLAGHLVLVGVKLAQNETNGAKLKVLATSFKTFPALVTQVGELGDYQTDRQKLQAEQATRQ